MQHKRPTNIGNNVSIGHNAIVHGCTIHDNVLIGMGSIIMDDCIIESNSIIAAGAVVTKNTLVPSGSIYAGTPARKIKDISKELISGEINRIANNYIKYSNWFSDDAWSDLGIVVILIISRIGVTEIVYYFKTSM